MATKTGSAEALQGKHVRAGRNGKAIEVISIPRIEIAEMEVKLIGDSPLIMHQWGEKAKAQIRDKQAKKPRAENRPKRDPKAEYEASMYRDADGGYAFPAVAFKAAAVSACRFNDIQMTIARGAFHVIGELVPITGEPNMREDMVRVGMGAADLRYRGEFKDWSTVLTVRYNAAALSAGQLVNLFNIAGFGVGVGEWRPEKNGSYGMFHVEVA